jgi:hypothetical protein
MMREATNKGGYEKITIKIRDAYVKWDFPQAGFSINFNYERTILPDAHRQSNGRFFSEKALARIAKFWPKTAPRRHFEIATDD